jgi:bla regulator protein BlaR1
MVGQTARGAILAFLGGCCAVPTHGQILHATGPLPSFEVATIRPWKPDLRPMTGPATSIIDPVPHVQSQDTDRVHFIGQIDLLIMDAYNLPVGSDSRILKGPKWVDSEDDRYEVEAKIDAETFASMRKMTPEQQHEKVALMEQSLLAERFNLKVHFEEQGEPPVYALVVAKGGPKLTASKNGEPGQLSFLNDELTAQAITISQFAQSPLWTPIGDRFVVDRTGLTGTYDFTLKWRSDPLDESGDLPPLFDAIREQLGLKVVESQAPREVIVIDHIARPSKN